MTTTLTRPNGKTYRPRKPELDARIWEDDGCDGPDCGVIVFGTLDVADPKAMTMALDLARRCFGCDDVGDGYAAWFRQSYSYGRRIWVVDTEKGRPGVCFTAVTA